MLYFVILKIKAAVRFSRALACNALTKCIHLTMFQPVHLWEAFTALDDNRSLPQDDNHCFSMVWERLWKYLASISIYNPTVGITCLSCRVRFAKSVKGLFHYGKNHLACSLRLFSSNHNAQKFILVRCGRWLRVCDNWKEP